MIYLKVVFSTLGSLVALFLLTKLMGNRQTSQLSMFDYVIGITIGSIAAEMATKGTMEFIFPLIALIIYAVCSAIISLLTDKFITLRRIIDGTATIIYDSGKLYKFNMKRKRISMDEFLTLCRNQGYFNIADIQTAVLENNGKLSILPAVTARPASVGDLKLIIPQEKPLKTLIIDGKILRGNLKHTGNDTDWLKKRLKEQKIDSIKNVFLATCDDKNNLSVYLKTNGATVHDIFQ